MQWFRKYAVALSVVLSLWLFSACMVFVGTSHAADYTVSLSVDQETALSYATEQANVRLGITYCTGAGVTTASPTVTLKAAETGWVNRWFKVTADGTYYRILSVDPGVSLTLTGLYLGTTASRQDCTVHADNGVTPLSAAIPDKTKAQVLQAIADADLANALRNLDARITPIVPKLKAVDSTTRTTVIATDPSPAARSRATTLAEQ